jgi:hypothetical protein
MEQEGSSRQEHGNLGGVPLISNSAVKRRKRKPTGAVISNTLINIDNFFRISFIHICVTLYCCKLNCFQ